MMRIFTVFILFLLLSTNTFSNKHLKGHEAEEKVPGATELWYKSGNELPSYIRFASDFVLKESDLLYWLRAQFNMDTELGLTKTRTVVGKKGMVHSTYTLKRDDIELALFRINVHSKDGLVKSISGDIVDNVVVKNNIGLDEVLANRKAVDQFKHSLNSNDNDDVLDADLNAASQLVIYANKNASNETDYRFAHKVLVEAKSTVGKKVIYIDAADGSVLAEHNLVHHVDSVGKANTGYSGHTQITSDFSSGQFRLRENGRGGGIYTWNIQNTTDFSNAVDFWNDNNNWFFNPSAGDLDRYATDAHWAAEMTYDFFKSKFGRSSYDGFNAELNLYVHYGEGYDEATWDGDNILIGDGLNGLPHATVDVIGHEFTHGVIESSAGLIGSGESGALAESFADIFGNCVEMYAKSDETSWKIGEDRLAGLYLRDMENPNEKSHPDTYKGNFWYTGSDDNGGVHINCGVQNYWFYLVASGGSGKNDLGNVYSVTGIGKEDAAAIAYEVLTGYLSPNSDYEDAHYYTVQVAIDLFGHCSPQHTAVENAWYAVGLGEKFEDEAIASFYEMPMSYCNLPFTVNFENNSINGESYLWDFGDGTTSTEVNPSHTYTELGTYSVELTVTGLDHCGVNTLREDDLITVNQPAEPHSIDPPGDHVSANAGDQVLLKATTGAEEGEVYWYEHADDDLDEYIAIGETYIIPSATEADTFFIKTLVPGDRHGIGEDVDEAVSNGEYSSAGYTMNFDMLQTAIIESVKVNSKDEGSKTLIIKDANGNQVFNASYDLKSGVNEILINIELDKGNAYEMLISGTEKNLWRSHDVAFPYEISGLISLNGTALNTNVYPYFYNWVVKENDCQSSTSSITVGIKDVPEGSDETPYNFYYESRSNGSMSYHLTLNFTTETSVNYGLYSISGQMLYAFTSDKKVRHEENLTQLLGLDNLAGGVYFITIQGGILEKSERVIIKTGSN